MIVERLETLYKTRFQDKEDQLRVIDSDEFLELINEAQAEAAIRADLIYDSTSSFCTIPVKAGVTTYKLDSKIYGVPYARLIDSDGHVYKLEGVHRDDYSSLEPSVFSKVKRPDHYRHFGRFIDLINVPDADYTLKLETYRLPIDLTDSSSTPEIEEIHQRGLLNWVLYRAYELPDEDSSNPKKAGEHLALFTRQYGEHPEAATHKDKFVSRPHHNRVSYLP